MSSGQIKTSTASCLRDHALVGCRDGCRDQLRRKEDQETQRPRESIMPLANRKIGWDGGCGKGGHEQSSRIGAAVADASCKLRAETGDRGQQRANCK